MKDLSYAVILRWGIRWSEDPVLKQLRLFGAAYSKYYKNTLVIDNSINCSPILPDFENVVKCLAFFQNSLNYLIIVLTHDVKNYH